MQRFPFVQKEWIFWLSSTRCSCQEVFSCCPSSVVPTAHMPKKYNPSAIVCLRSFLNTLANVENNRGWQHLLAWKLAGWQLSLASSTNDQGKNWSCQRIRGPASTREGLCWALCRTLSHFLLVWIYSARLALLTLCINLFFFCPPSL